MKKEVYKGISIYFTRNKYGVHYSIPAFRSQSDGDETKADAFKNAKQKIKKYKRKY